MYIQFITYTPHLIPTTAKRTISNFLRKALNSDSKYISAIDCQQRKKLKDYVTIFQIHMFVDELPSVAEADNLKEKFDDLLFQISEEEVA